MSDVTLTVISDKEAQLSTTQGQLCAQSERAVICCDEDSEKATDLSKWIASFIKKIEDERKSIVGPFNDKVKEINARFKAMTGPLDAANKTLRGKMTDYLRDKEQRERAAALALRKQQEEEALAHAEKLEHQGQTELANEHIEQAVAHVPVVRKVAPTRGDFGGVSNLRDNWTWEVEDIVALAKARPDLVMPHTTAINHLVKRAIQPEREIPGLRIFNDRKLAVR